jgi:hypothetical protein
LLNRHLIRPEFLHVTSLPQDDEPVCGTDTQFWKPLQHTVFVEQHTDFALHLWYTTPFSNSQRKHFTEAIMSSPTFDIFRQLSDGAPLWIEATATLHEAKQRVAELSSAHPGNYAIYDMENDLFVVPFPDRTETA